MRDNKMGDKKEAGTVKVKEKLSERNREESKFPKPGKIGAPKHRKVKMKRHLMRAKQNIRKRHMACHEACFKKKHEHSRLSRKRIHGCYKRTKHSVIIPPTKFLLGGNITDPLNLNSLQDEETNRRMNATPRSSPLTASRNRQGEIEVIIPKNRKDPLNLNSCRDPEVDQKLTKRRKPRHRKRKRGNSGSGSGKDESTDTGAMQDENVAPPEKPVEEVKTEEEEKPKSVDATTQTRKESLCLSIKEAPARHRARKMDAKDKIVSPVIPQPGAWKRPMPRNLPPPNRKKQEKKPQFKAKNIKYQYGNYDRYYGYRNPNQELDVRLKCLEQHKELFFDKDILDIGCNIGHITLCVARDFGARTAVGLDIDKKLIGIARKNVKHYVNYADTPAYSGGFSVRNQPPFESPMYKKHRYHFQDSPIHSRVTPLHPYPESPVHRTTHQYCMESPSYTPSGKNTPYYSMESPSYQPSLSESPHHRGHNYAHHSPFYSLESPSYQSHSSHEPDPQPPQAPDKPNDKFFPISMPILYGPVDPPGISTQHDASSPHKFPHNVTFVQGNYVLESEDLLSCETQFDVILGLSITKWIHLNWGDAGLKQAFKRMFSQLRPGGKLVLEAQNWASYRKKKSLTEAMYDNFHNIELFPEQFTEYLLSSEVGFSSVEVLATPQHHSKGFQRPLRVFTKPGLTPSRCNTPASICRSTPNTVRFTPYAQRTCVRRPVYTALTVDEDSSTSPRVDIPHALGSSTSPRVDIPHTQGRAPADVSHDVLSGSEVSFQTAREENGAAGRAVVRMQQDGQSFTEELATRLDPGVNVYETPVSQVLRQEPVNVASMATTLSKRPYLEDSLQQSPKEESVGGELGAATPPKRPRIKESPQQIPYEQVGGDELGAATPPKRSDVEDSPHPSQLSESQ